MLVRLHVWLCRLMVNRWIAARNPQRLRTGQRAQWAQLVRIADVCRVLPPAAYSKLCTSGVKGARRVHGCTLMGWHPPGQAAAARWSVTASACSQHSFFSRSADNMRNTVCYLERRLSMHARTNSCMHACCSRSTAADTPKHNKRHPHVDCLIALHPDAQRCCMIQLQAAAHGRSTSCKASRPVAHMHVLTPLCAALHAACYVFQKA